MNGIRWGLCCLFKEEPIHFGVRQAVHLAKFDRRHQLTLLVADHTGQRQGAAGGH